MQGRWKTRLAGVGGLLLLALALPVRAETFELGSLDLGTVEQTTGVPRANRSVGGHPLSVAGHPFAVGLGTHAASQWRLLLSGRAQRFTAWVGVDDEVGAQGSLRFKLVGDGRTLWESPVLRGGQPAVPVSVNLQGVRQLKLCVEDGGDGPDFDHADWAEARIVMAEGAPEPTRAAGKSAW